AADAGREIDRQESFALAGQAVQDGHLPERQPAVPQPVELLQLDLVGGDPAAVEVDLLEVPDALQRLGQLPVTPLRGEEVLQAPGADAVEEDLGVPEQFGDVDLLGVLGLVVEAVEEALDQGQRGLVAGLALAPALVVADDLPTGGVAVLLVVPDTPPADQ